MGKREENRLFDEAVEIAAGEVCLLDISMTTTATAQIEEASAVIQRDFNNLRRELERSKRELWNARDKAMKSGIPIVTSVQGVQGVPNAVPSLNEPVKVVRVEVSGRANARILRKAARELFLYGKTTFVFAKPVLERK